LGNRPITRPQAQKKDDKFPPTRNPCAPLIPAPHSRDHRQPPPPHHTQHPHGFSPLTIQPRREGHAAGSRPNRLLHSGTSDRPLPEFNNILLKYCNRIFMFLLVILLEQLKPASAPARPSRGHEARSSFLVTVSKFSR